MLNLKNLEVKGLTKKVFRITRHGELNLSKLKGL